MYFLSTVAEFLCISVLICAFFPFPLYPYATSVHHSHDFLFLSPPFQDVSTFISASESCQSLNETTSLEKSQRLLEFEVFIMTFQ